MSFIAEIYAKLFAPKSHSHEEYASSSHTHTKSQITDFGSYAAPDHNHDSSYAAKSHGTHVSTTSCVTSFNGSKGAVTVPITNVAKTMDSFVTSLGSDLAESTNVSGNNFPTDNNNASVYFINSFSICNVDFVTFKVALKGDGNKTVDTGLKFSTIYTVQATQCGAGDEDGSRLLRARTNNEWLELMFRTYSGGAAAFYVMVIGKLSGTL